MYKKSRRAKLFIDAMVILLQLVGPGIYPTVCASLIDQFGMTTSGTCETEGIKDRIAGYAMLVSCAFHQYYGHQLVTEDDDGVDLGTCSSLVSSKAFSSDVKVT